MLQRFIKSKQVKFGLSWFNSFPSSFKFPTTTFKTTNSVNLFNSFKSKQLIHTLRYEVPYEQVGELLNNSVKPEAQTDKENTVRLTLPDGTVFIVKSGSCLADISEVYREKYGLIASLMNNEPFDPRTPIYNPGRVSLVFEKEVNFLKDGSLEIKAVNSAVWNSSSVLLSLAVLRMFGQKRALSLSSEIDTERGGFYSDFLLLSSKTSLSPSDWVSSIPDEQFVAKLSSEQLKELKAIMANLVKQNIPFKKTTIPLKVANEFFGSNQLFQSQDYVDIWNLEELIFTSDVPLVKHTGQLKIIDLSSSELVHHKNLVPLRQCVTRIYGTGFFNARSKSDWDKKIKKAKESDHRVLGQNQRLFMTHQFSPGAPFFLTHGTRIIQRLQDFLRKKYRQFGFEEVLTPIVYKKDLFKISGHWENYQENMFSVQGCCNLDESQEPGEAGLKPMNCPAHCLIFDSVPRSELDLPIRFADFGALHRNEASGALSGLTRVRQFHQDDGHIFCRPDQIAKEISSCLELLKQVYSAIDLNDYVLSLSTRPVCDFIGSEEEWNQAETALKRVLDATGQAWFVKEGDGAFYGPKIDIMVKDALGRSHQTATIQLDFQLPVRFNLRYKLIGGGTATPVIVHRAVFGSIERILAILIEHHSGRWPFWLSPRQVIICPTGSAQDYASKVLDEFNFTLDSNNLHIYIDLDRSQKNLSAMIKSAQKAQYNFMVIVGDKEASSNTITIRSRNGEVVSNLTVTHFIKNMVQMQTGFKDFVQIKPLVA